MRILEHKELNYILACWIGVEFDDGKVMMMMMMMMMLSPRKRVVRLEREVF
jgi:hypothetical protein